MHEFTDDDHSYLDWLSAHPHGYVLNASNPPTAAYLKVHRATCHTINGTPTNGTAWTTGYVKVCALSSADLYAWGQQQTGGLPTTCGTCQPQ